jgi:Ribonucleotide reductase, all-alpha domain
MSSLPFDFDVHGQLVPAPEIAPGRAMPGPKLIRKAAPHPAPMPGPPPKPSDLVLDRTRDGWLTPLGKATLSDRYLMPGESFQDMFARVACAYADDKAHAQRLYDAISRLWFMPATPVLSNGGTTRGLPISRIRCRGSWKSSTASSTPISSSSAPPNIPKARAGEAGTETAAYGRISRSARARPRPGGYR